MKSNQKEIRATLIVMWSAQAKLEDTISRQLVGILASAIHRTQSLLKEPCNEITKDEDW
jgi:hypothetical protein